MNLPAPIERGFLAGASTLDGFYRLGGALARTVRGPVPVTFAAFDLLWLDGELLTGRP